MTTRREPNLDHGDEPITLEEVIASIASHAITIRLLGARAKRIPARWTPEFEIPSFEVTPIPGIEGIAE